jgi:hypothetical protein
MHDDGVDGVFDLVANAGSEPANGRHAARELQLRLDLFGRLQIVQGHQRAQPLAGVVVVDEVQRCLNAAAGFGENLFLTRVMPASKASRRVWPSTVERSKIFARVQAQDAVAVDCRKRRAASETSTARRRR